MKSVMPPNVFDSFAGYFEEPRTGSCPRFEEKKEVVEEVIDVSKEMTGEVLKDIADKALMGKLKEVDSEPKDSQSVDKVSVNKEETGVQEVESAKQFVSKSKHIGKIDCHEKVDEKDVPISETPCQHSYDTLARSIKMIQKESIENDKATKLAQATLFDKQREVNYHLDTIASLRKELELAKIENDRIDKNIDITFTASDTDNESQVIKNVIDQVLDDESEKSEKANSEKTVSDSEDEGNFLDRYVPKSEKSMNDDPIMVNVKIENVEKVFKLVELNVNEINNKDFFSKLKKSFGTSRPTSSEKKDGIGKGQNKKNQLKNKGIGFEKKMAKQVIKPKEKMNDVFVAGPSTDVEKEYIFSQKVVDDFNAAQKLKEETVNTTFVEYDKRVCYRCNEIGHMAKQCQKVFKKHVVEKPVQKQMVERSKGLPKSILSRWIMDSGASRHMTGSLALLYDVKSINGSYVGFAGNQGGRMPTSVLFNPIHNVCCSLDEEQNPMLSEFRDILEFMRRVPILKALTEKRLVFRSHIKRFWKHASYDDQNKTINSVVKINDEKKPIVISEAVVREVLEFPDEENSPTKLPEKMVKGCMLRMGYAGDLNSASYLKSKFTKPYKFLIHSVLIAMSHQKGGFDIMRDYLMNMVVALVLNKKYNFSHIVFHYMVDEINSDRKTWLYPRFVQMMLDHAYPNLFRDENNDLLVLSHMDNDSIRSLARYHPKYLEPTKAAELFGAIKDSNYQDPDPENHEHWRNEAERKEKGYAEELKILKNFISKRSEWFLNEQKKKTRKATPTVKQVEGSSSHPRKKQKKAATMSLVDEPEEDNPVVTAEKEQVAATADDPFNTDVLFDADLLETGPEIVANVEQVVNVEAQKEKEKVADDIEGDDVDKSTTSSLDSSDEEVVDETERLRRIQEEIEKEKLLRKRKRQEKDDDDVYVPSPEHVSGSQSSPRVRKKAGGRKKIVSPKIVKATPKIKLPKTVLKKKKQTKKPPTPPHKPTPPQSPIQSPLRQPTPPQQSSPPKQPTPPRQPSPIHQSPPPQQTVFSSQDLFGTPPLSQIQPGTSGRGLHTPQDNLLDVGDFDFANTSQVRNVEKKVEEVVAENKKLAAENKKVSDRERLLEAHVKKLENENQELVKKIDADQTEIDILKVRVAELEEEKNRRDSQNKYFKLKNKELEAAKKARDHEFYMLNKVVESMLGTSIEEKFEELQVEEIRAQRQAEIEK
ncbi:uncharacterized protein LOC110870360 [Helianthus annuus]|uniref:uncharacterized protein LOC110870360 n=1 Tax=Helianthus annuus TaxID=4232 RepID=UPI000B8F281E|nr:uncharacterized protein LOC110870360 [Helianthus annuus]